MHERNNTPIPLIISDGLNRQLVINADELSEGELNAIVNSLEVYRDQHPEERGAVCRAAMSSDFKETPNVYEFFVSKGNENNQNIGERTKSLVNSIIENYNVERIVDISAVTDEEKIESKKFVSWYKKIQKEFFNSLQYTIFWYSNVETYSRFILNKKDKFFSDVISQENSKIREMCDGFPILISMITSSLQITCNHRGYFLEVHFPLPFSSLQEVASSFVKIMNTISSKKQDSYMTASSLDCFAQYYITALYIDNLLDNNILKRRRCLTSDDIYKNIKDGCFNERIWDELRRDSYFISQSKPDDSACKLIIQACSVLEVELIYIVPSRYFHPVYRYMICTKNSFVYIPICKDSMNIYIETLASKRINNENNFFYIFVCVPKIYKFRDTITLFPTLFYFLVQLLKKKEDNLSQDEWNIWPCFNMKDASYLRAKLQTWSKKRESKKVLISSTGMPLKNFKLENDDSYMISRYNSIRKVGEPNE